MDKFNFEKKSHNNKPFITRETRPVVIVDEVITDEIVSKPVEKGLIKSAKSFAESKTGKATIIGVVAFSVIAIGGFLAYRKYKNSPKEEVVEEVEDGE